LKGSVNCCQSFILEGFARIRALVSRDAEALLNKFIQPVTSIAVKLAVRCPERIKPLSLIDLAGFYISII
jgi:hypothetical protein